MHVSCRNRAIVDVNLSSVFATDEERGALAAVKSLDLGENEITRIQGLQPFCSLTSLDLSRNKLVSLKGLPLGLVKLNVAFNHITSLEGTHMLPHLSELDASHNKLNDVRGLPRAAPLQTLKLSHNRIPSANGLEHLQQLQALDLDHNYICLTEDLRALGGCVELRNLSVRGNPCADHSAFKVALAGVVPSLTLLDGAPLPAKRPASLRRSASPWGAANRSSAATSRSHSRQSRTATPSKQRAQGGYTSRREAPSPRGQLPSPRLLQKSPGGRRGGASRSLNSSLQDATQPGPGAAALFAAATLPQGAAGLGDLVDRFDDPGLAHPPSPPRQQPEPYILSRGMEIRGGAARPMGASLMDESGITAPGPHHDTGDDDLMNGMEDEEAVVAFSGGQGISYDTANAGVGLEVDVAAAPVPAAAAPRRTARPARVAQVVSPKLAAPMAGMPTKVGELQRLLDDEHRLTATLQKGKRKVEAELSEVRRVLADELAKLAAAKEESQRLRKDNEEWKGRSEKHQREYKYAHLKLQEVRQKHQEELETLRTQHKAEVNSLKAKLRQHTSGAGGSYIDWQMERVKLMDYVTQLEEQNSTLQMHQSHAAPPDTSAISHAHTHISHAHTHTLPGASRIAAPSSLNTERDRVSASEGEGWSESGDDAAQQIQFAVGLKKWLLSELEKGGAPDKPDAAKPRGGGGGAHGAPPNIEELWSHNLSLLQQGQGSERTLQAHGDHL